MMEEHEIIIEDSTYRILNAIVRAKDDAISIAVAAEIEPEKFRQFLSENGLSNNQTANQLLRAAEAIKFLKESRAALARSARESFAGGATMSGATVTLTGQLTSTLRKLIADDVLAPTNLPRTGTLAKSLHIARGVVQRSYADVTELGSSQTTSAQRAGRKSKGQSKKTTKDRKRTGTSAESKQRHSARKLSLAKRAAKSKVLRVKN